MSLQRKAQYDKELIKCPRCGGTIFYYDQQVTLTHRVSIEVDNVRGTDILEDTTNHLDNHVKAHYTPKEVFCDSCDTDVTKLVKEHI